MIFAIFQPLDRSLAKKNLTKFKLKQIQCAMKFFYKFEVDLEALKMQSFDDVVEKKNFVLLSNGRTRRWAYKRAANWKGERDLNARGRVNSLAMND